MTAFTPEPPTAVSASSAVRVEGRLLTADLLGRLAAGDRELPGCAPADYGLYRGERIGDAAGRAWAALTGAYRVFRDDLARLPETSAATTLTRKAWLLRLFTELGYGRLSGTGVTVEIPGRDETCRASHRWQDHLPVHLLAWGTSLDGRVGNRRAPQSVLQELLNVSGRHVWGLLSNGQVLRVLRDSTALVGSAYVEFDLEAIFDGQQYADFVLLYSLLHASRFELVAKPEKKRRGRRARDPQGAESEFAEAAEQQDGEEQPAQTEFGDEDTASDSDASALTAADCRIEWLRTYAIETGLRARDNLRDQVAEAIGVLGTGFLAANPDLHRAVSGGGRRGLGALEELHHELLRLAYQLVFLFVAEDRGILLDRTDSPEAQDARDRYTRYFSTRRLRRIAFRRPGDRNTDLWRSLAMVLDALGTDGGEPRLALPELGGLYFRAKDDSAAATLLGRAEPLRAAELPNEHLLEAVRLLARVRDEGRRWQRVDYRHLGADELGSVYESLLELRPRRDPGTGRFRLQTLAGNKRKTTGAYYTPTVLIEKLLDQALDPVIKRYAANGNPRDLLKINLVDPACGSGHVLVAAARRIARRYAELDTWEPEPAPEKVRAAMADVVRHCVHGVDINPMAVELAKVSLWLESLEPGQPLAYLDDRIKVGNGLLGTTPKLIAEGVPDGAFKKLAGDNSRILTALKAANKKERSGGKGTQTALGGALTRTGTAELRLEAEDIARLPDRTLADVRNHARAYEEYLATSPHLRRLKRVADAWCAAFLWPKNDDAPPAVTSSVLVQVAGGGELSAAAIEGAEAEEEAEPSLSGEQQLDETVSRNRFFHWHLEFPRVFRVEDDEADDHNPDTGWQGGFDCVLGNPPWERVKIQEKEWFAARGEDEIADASNASERKKLIAGLKESAERGERELYDAFQVALREAAGTTLMLRNSGIFPLTGQGDVNTYAVFAEKARMLLAPEGMSGLVLPTGIATDKTTSAFFADLVDRRQLVTVLDMENEEKLFPDVHNQYRFCLFTVSGPALRCEGTRLAFRARRPDQLDEREFTLDAIGFRAINPNSRTSPVCESPEHLRVLRGIHERVPVLWRRVGGDENPWELRFKTMFHMSGDSDLFLTSDELLDDGWSPQGTVFIRDDKRALPLYEGKFVHHFDGRFATYENATQAQINKGTLPRFDLEVHQDPAKAPLPRYWVLEEQVDDRLAGEPGQPETEWRHDWLMGWRDVCRASDERTVIASAVPRTAVGHTAPLLLPLRQDLPLDGLLANLSAFVLDFAARQKVSGAHLTYTYLEQLPILPPDTYTRPVPWLGDRTPDAWIRDRVLELTYNSYEMVPFARHLGDEKPPFIWNEDRRFEIRAELDAAYFHLYGIPETDIELVLDSFRAFRNKSPELFERTKDRILTIYREMEKAAESGGSYTNQGMTPPPGRSPRHAPGHSPLTRPERATPEPPQPPEPTGAKPPSDEPDADGGLFSVAELGVDEQLGFWS
ncbi:N-6 DNA methylase [Streptomyces sp. NBC_01788]|uniref:Eco57I restriction-modification methylase domain-containing protein n=1 Tax=Streptomyces sp. NBC_01788 TaxID=2975940 RepID=UPI002DD967AD|nr:N-6 DNA methylase [Streptomyces sp. NBC_01788]WSB26059.1 N-6 DNA methylase [Streptomyces sp. NBC_01788]